MSKYGNKKFKADGILWDSKKEFARWCELRILEKGKVISDLQRQKEFELIPKQRDSQGKAIRAVKYKADFVYIENNKLIVEDCKGFKTEVYKLKKKLMLYVHGIEIRET